MKLLALAILLGLPVSFWLGRLEGRQDGPVIRTTYIDPIVMLSRPNEEYCPAIVLGDKGWHEGYGWHFRGLDIDSSKRTVSCLLDRRGMNMDEVNMQIQECKILMGGSQ